MVHKFVHPSPSVRSSCVSFCIYRHCSRIVFAITPIVYNISTPYIYSFIHLSYKKYSIQYEASSARECVCHFSFFTFTNPNAHKCFFSHFIVCAIIIIIMYGITSKANVCEFTHTLLLISFPTHTHTHMHAHING